MDGDVISNGPIQPSVGWKQMRPGNPVSSTVVSGLVQGKIYSKP
jgi:hypothetical protein